LEPVPLATGDLTTLDSEDPGGPAFLVPREGDKPQYFFVYGDQLLIGRSDDVHLPVPLKSISRHHARVTVGSEGVVIEDLMSENGTFVNGVKIERRVLEPKDEIRLGTFELIYLGDQTWQQVYDGVPLDGLERYTRLMSGFDVEATFRVPMALIERRNEITRLIKHGTLVEVGGEGRWRSGQEAVRIGKGADVPATELLASGVLAELAWSGRRHELRKAARRATVKVNGTKVDRHELVAGDKVQVGRAKFVYEVDA